MTGFIIFATADWDEPYWTNKQHTAKSFSELGHKVLYIESVGLRAPKVGSKKDLFRILNRLKSGVSTVIFGARNGGENIWILSPLLIPAAHRYPLIKKINTLLLQWLIKRHCHKYCFDERIIWTYHPYIIETIEQLPYKKIIYHCVDDLSAIPGIDKEYYLQQEKRLLILADKVYATTESLKARCGEYQRNTEYLSNVVDFEHFSKAFDKPSIPDDIKKIPSPRAIYHGVLSDFKVDFDLLLQVAESNPEISFVILGDEREGQQSPSFSALKALRNVYALGYRSYNILPNYLAYMDVALLPSLINAYTNYMFPMKYYEYLAAGLPVVSTALRFTESVSDGISVAHSQCEFSSCIKTAIQNGRLTRSQAFEYVGENTWRERTRKMLTRINIGVSN